MPRFTSGTRALRGSLSALLSPAGWGWSNRRPDWRRAAVRAAVPTDAAAGTPADYARAVLTTSITPLATLTTVETGLAARGPS